MYEQFWEDYGLQNTDQSVRLAVRELKRECRSVFIPLTFEPGEMAEVGWDTAKVVMLGRIIGVHLFCAGLRYSRMPFVVAIRVSGRRCSPRDTGRCLSAWTGYPAGAVSKTSIVVQLCHRSISQRHSAQELADRWAGH